ncbi:MAG: hypothetical protein ABC360_07910 [Acetomicrobium sp.]
MQNFIIYVRLTTVFEFHSQERWWQCVDAGPGSRRYSAMKDEVTFLNEGHRLKRALLPSEGRSYTAAALTASASRYSR